MKIITVFLAAFAVVGVQAAPASDCALPNHACPSVKRAADATQDAKRLANALAEAISGFSVDKWCSFPGQGCLMAKRAVETANGVVVSTEDLVNAMAALETLKDV